MARFRISAVAAVFFILTLGLGASRSASQKPGFQSINCGGEAFTDPNTLLSWEEDPFNKNGSETFHGQAGKVTSSLKNSTNATRTLRYFPSDKKNSKFCYSLPISNGETYLIRASFLYGNYDELRQPPTFLLILNYDIWTTVSTSLSSTPITQELTFISNEKSLNICVAPIAHQNHTPFISTIELRLLNNTMYSQNPDSTFKTALQEGHGLMLWQRINYGAKTEAAIRYPTDDYDRIWEANTTGPTLSTSKVGINDIGDETQPPAAVMATAIYSGSMKENLTFTYNEGGYGGIQAGFRMDIHFEELDEKVKIGLRQMGFAFPNSTRDGDQLIPNSVVNTQFPIESVAGAPVSVTLDEPLELPSPNLHLTLYPYSTSSLGPLLNAIELFFWTPHPLSTSGTSPGDVNALTQIQEQLEIIGYGQGDPCMPKGYEWAWIACNEESPPKITQINLASFNLTGVIPPIINELASLERVDLSDNRLVGPIPNLSNLHALQYLDVSYNYLCGSAPSLPTSVTFKHMGNNGLCDGSSCQCTSSSYSSKFNNHNHNKYIFAISFMGALYVVLLLILFISYMARHIRRKEENARSSIKEKQKDDGLKGLLYNTKMFTYNEINNATLNFTTLLGEGGFGKVYHGRLPTSEAIAVKMLANVSKQGLKEFYNEVSILSRVRHKNLVSLLGYCVENTYMLIYEYVAKGNVKDLLYGDGESSDKPLPWNTRLQIALDASQGLDYLHTGCDPAIIHRDVKTSNILLSDKMQAKVADFGLSRLKEGDTISHVSTHNVVGTPGYLDPAYNATNQLTDKSDVYSFGVVLLELICARAPIDMFTSPTYIVEWAKSSIMQGKVEDIMDPILANGCRVVSVSKVVELAFGCLDGDRMKRPKMSQISQILQDTLEIELEQSSTPFSKDVSGTPSTADEKIPTPQYIENIQMRLEPR